MTIGKFKRSIWITLMLLSVSCVAQQYINTIDLDRMLKDQDHLQRLAIFYFAADHPIGLRIYGDGRMVTTSIRATDISQTCTSRISQAELKHLLQTMLDRHFLKLPMRQYLMLNPEPSPDGDPMGELNLHSIHISDGEGRTVRSFGTGTYNGEHLTIPEDFAVVEQELRLLRERVLDSPEGSLCRLAVRNSQMKKTGP